MRVLKKEVTRTEITLYMTAEEASDIKSILCWANSDSVHDPRLVWNKDFKDRLSLLYRDILFVD